MMKCKKGFTLIELVLVIALLAVVGGLMMSLTTQGLRLFNLNVDSAEEQQSLRQPLSEISNRVRLAEPGEISADGGSVTIGSNTYWHNSADKTLWRNYEVFASHIESFTASKDDGVLHITIKSEAGTQIQTSLAISK